MTNQTEDNVPTGKVEFIAFHQPPLKKGNYTITVTQTVEAGSDIEKTVFPEAKRYFSVLGPRFSLEPQEIQAVFPPPGSLGEHSNVLPHLILNRSTLPWERSPDHASEETPWLALLLFDEAEVQAEQVRTHTLTLGELKQSVDKFPQFFPQGTALSALPKNKSYLVEEYGQYDDDSITVIEVNKALLKSIIPRKDDLKWLTHVRQAKDVTKKPEGQEAAVIICNRLPEPGSASTVHLVSVEGCYRGNTDTFDDRQTGETIYLVSLKNWRFACVSEKHGFRGLLIHLNHHLLFNLRLADETLPHQLNQRQIPSELRSAFEQNRQPLRAPSVEAICHWQIRDADYYYLIGLQANGEGQVYNRAGKLLFSVAGVSLNVSESPAQILTKITPLFNQQGRELKRATIKQVGGHWWLKDERRLYFISQEGQQFYVYYQDPDLTGTLRLPNNANANAEKYLAMGCAPLLHAMRQGNKTVSWYRGPLVPGANTSPDIPLPVRAADNLVFYNETLGMFEVSYAAAWELGRLLTLQNKSASVNLFNWKRAHTQSLKDAEQQLTHLPFDGPSASLDLPQTVRAWFEHLALLQGIPFHYLVPAEGMLPPESIRFFQVDWLWVECLLDGAFSIGRVLASDWEQDMNHNNRPKRPHRGPVSGFLLRSDVVAGWPNLQIDGYDTIVDNEHFVPGKTLLFELDLSLRSELNKGNLTALQQRFQPSLSPNIRIEVRRWLIVDSDHNKRYDLVKSENNIIDVRLIDPDTPDKMTFLSSIDASLEPDLNTGHVSTDLQRMFDPPLSSDSNISVIGWYIADDDQQRHYFVQAESDALEVYREVKLPLLRLERLSQNILICLFEGIVQTVDIHQRPETLHFGLNRPDGEPNHAGYYKELRNQKGEERPEFMIKVLLNDKRVVNISESDGLIDQINALHSSKENTNRAAAEQLAWKNSPTSAQFALQMIEGVQKVRFVRQSSHL